MEISEFQALIESIYLEKDSRRGVPATFMWLAEEVGELSRAIRRGDSESLRGEFADVLAWTVSLASLCGVDLAEAVTAKYAGGCPKCGATPCRCQECTGYLVVDPLQLAVVFLPVGQPAQEPVAELPG